MADSETAFVFDDESHSGTDAVHFGGFPGVYVPDEKVAVSELDFASVKDATDLADELGVPLKRTTVKAGAGKMVARENHALSEAQARELKDFKPEAGQPGAELAEGEVFPPAREPLPEAASPEAPPSATDPTEVV